MTKLMINDLEMNQELSEKEMGKVRGGDPGWGSGSNSTPSIPSWDKTTRYGLYRTEIKPYTFYSYMRLGG